VELYQALIQFRDSDLSPIFVKEADDFNVVEITRVSQTYRGKSMVKLHFTEDEFEEIMFPDDNGYNNSKSTYNACQSGYGTVFVDDWWSDEEIKEGYILHHFNDENLNLYREIIRFYNPALSEFEINDSGDAARFFYDKFGSEAGDIGWEYGQRYDEALREGCVQYVENKLCGNFTDYGIIEKECREVYLTTVDMLLFIWDSTNTPKDGSIMDLFKNFTEQNDLHLDEDLYEDYYSYYEHSNFDDEGFQSSVNRILERLKEQILENFEESHLVEYKKFNDLFNKLGYRLKDWNDIPKEKTFGIKGPAKFKISDFTDGKIVIFYSPDGNFGIHQEKMIMSFEDFKNFLYHPELF